MQILNQLPNQMPSGFRHLSLADRLVVVAQIMKTEHATPSERPLNKTMFKGFSFSCKENQINEFILLINLMGDKIKYACADKTDTGMWGVVYFEEALTIQDAQEKLAPFGASLQKITDVMRQRIPAEPYFVKGTLPRKPMRRPAPVHPSNAVSDSIPHPSTPPPLSEMSESDDE